MLKRCMGCREIGSISILFSFLTIDSFHHKCKELFQSTDYLSAVSAVYRLPMRMSLAVCAGMKVGFPGPKIHCFRCVFIESVCRSSLMFVPCAFEVNIQYSSFIFLFYFVKQGFCTPSLTFRRFTPLVFLINMHSEI